MRHSLSKIDHREVGWKKVELLFDDRSRLALLRQILAITDHDRQFSRGGHITYGEAVGAVPQKGMVARPRRFGFAESHFRLFGQLFRGPMATPMQRSGSENLTQ